MSRTIRLIECSDANKPTILGTDLSPWEAEASEPPKAPPAFGLVASLADDTERLDRVVSGLIDERRLRGDAISYTEALGEVLALADAARGFSEFDDRDVDPERLALHKRIEEYAYRNEVSYQGSNGGDHR